jgi:hypothetical protein
LLFNFGLAGLLVFLVFVVERQLRGLRSVSNGLFLTLYPANWLVTFGVVALLAYRGFFPSEFTLSGEVQNLKGGETVRGTGQADEFYTFQKYRSQTSDVFDLRWRVTSNRPLASLSFLFFKGPADDGERHSVAVDPTAYKTGLTMRYNRENNTLVLVGSDGKEQKTVSADAPVTHAVLEPWLETVVFAAVEPSVDAIFGRLQSNDPLVRRDARRELAQLGLPILPSIEKVLLSETSSYLLRVGTLSVLTNMPGVSSKITEPALAAITAMTKDRDPVVRDLASSLVTNAEVVRLEVNSPTITRWRITKPTVTQPETIYDQIALKAGDNVKLTAGGCVQTGGSGLTWKRYVDPEGSRADSYYFGLVRLPGMSQSRMSAIVGKTVSISSDGPFALGYKDDFYSDNGYWNRDPGTGGQCKAEPDAWVVLEILHAKK